MRKRRLLLTGLGAVALLAGMAVGFLPALVNVSRHQGLIQSQLEQKLHRKVSLGAIRLQRFPLAVLVADVTVGEDPAIASKGDFVAVQSVVLRPGLLSLLRGVVEVEELTLEEPAIEVIRARDGAWNFASLGGGATEASKGQAQVQIRDLTIRNGRIGFTDRKSAAPRIVYEGIDVRLQDFVTGKDYRLSASARLPAESGSVEFTGSASSASPAQVNGKLAWNKVAVGPLLQFLHAGSPSTPIDSVIDGSAAITPAGESAIGVKGEIAISKQYPGKVQFDLSLDRSSGVFKINSLDAGVAGSQLHLVGEADPVSTPAASGGSPVSRILATGTLTAPKLTSGALLLTDVKTQLRLERGVATLSPLDAHLCGGDARGSIQIDLRGAVPAYHANLKLNQVDTEQLLAAVSPVRKRLYGKLLSDGDIHFNGTSESSLTRSLNGKLNLKITDGRLMGINFMNEVAKVGKFLGFQGDSKDYTAITALAGSLDIHNGVAEASDLALQMTGAAVAGDGTIDLVNQTLDLRFTVSLDKELSDKVGGRSIGGFMVTALASANGQLVVPARVTGTFAQPHVTPDAERFAKMKLKGIAPAVTDSVFRIFDRFTKQPKEQQ